MVFRGVSANGAAIRTTGGGGDGLDNFLGRSFSTDAGGEGEISTNSFGECIGDKIRVFFSSLIGFAGSGGGGAAAADGGVGGSGCGNGFFLGIIFDVCGFLLGFGGMGSFLTGIVV